MLERVMKIVGVGLYRDDRPAAHHLRKMTLIYGDNGRGKSTLASIIRSYNENNPNAIISRKTISFVDNQEVELMFSNGNRAMFSNGAWSQKHDSCHIFDLDFIDKNVYSGGEIKPSQRKNLLNFALGSAAVIAMNNLTQATNLCTQTAANLREADSRLLGYKGDQTVLQYKRIRLYPNLEQSLSEVDAKIGLSARTDLIKAKALIPKLQVLNIDVSQITNVMNKSVSSINDEVRNLVNSHVEKINKDGVEQWLSNGHSFSDDHFCPYCAQDIRDNELVRAYHSYFNQEIKAHLSTVSQLSTFKDTALNAINIEAVEQRYNNIIQSRDYWIEHVECEEIASPLDTLRQYKNDLKTIIENAITEKEKNPYEVLKSSYENESDEVIKKIGGVVNDFNSSIDRCNELITVFKGSLENIDIEALRVEKEDLEKNKVRYSQEVIDLIADWESKKTTDNAAKEDKTSKKDIFNGIMAQTLGQYETQINTLLANFGASFQIKRITVDYSGTGEARSEYVLEMRGRELTLHGENADFRTYLSEGDKRTLAFAFFISVVQSDPDLINKVVVIDDPMCSFDTNRKHHTITILKNIYTSSNQLIVMAHDIYFIKKIRDEFIKMNAIQTISEIKVSNAPQGYSKLMRLDVDKECESMYYKNHRLVSEYYLGENDHDEKEVAVAIRPLLEGYLHRRFPNTIAPNLLFGEIVNKINDSVAGSPLHHARSLVAELNQINSYAGRYHHDTNPNCANELVTPVELQTYCRRTLEVLYKGH
ncbi:AAA family ATPase [Citrobacter portucalensis]|uniref:AAA family ATPase n=1 Tax=Citrobacter portucalensis TaxID=1639133 RepID=UPI00207CF696|nr:AAA family ATPase [Citrobacter portucalensis]MCO4135732.1 AAA family ATPase [Citrobacter portucalensis]MCO4154327.1 AAA family ATPase [Citrobacter portucalensis]